jgi:Mg-chelatase subunit ChlD
MSRFTADTYQNEYLPLGASEVNAIVTVTSAVGDGAARQPDAAEIVILDTSGSMDVPRSKMIAARAASAVAIDCIRDGVAFGVIAGWDRAGVVYPKPTGALATASEQTRTEAKDAVRAVKADGGTAIGSWLALAGELFTSSPGRVGHAILLTDGENQHETAEELDRVLASLEGQFQCDCRGVGTD